MVEYPRKPTVKHQLGCPRSTLCGQLSRVETIAFLGHLSVLVPIAAFPAGLARRDVSLDGRAVRCHLATDRFTPRQGSMK